MYAAIHQKNFIAFHDELKVIKKYRKGLLKSHNIDIDVAYISKKKLKKIPDYADLYLVRYGDTYIQSKYYSTSNIDLKQLIYDLKYTKDILFRIIEIPDDDLSEEDSYHIEKVIELLYNKLNSIKEYTPTLSELKSMYDMYERYNESIDIPDAENKPWTY